jgi:hypothetical protein
MSWFLELFGFDEVCGDAAAWAQTRSLFVLSADGELTAPTGEIFAAGLFSTPTLGELRAAGRAALASGVAPRGGAGVTLAHEASGDVLCAHAAAPAGAVFLAASGLNCLEFVSPAAAPEDGIAAYERDLTQGPACALACAAGTVVRNYFSGNSPASQIDCLADLTAAVAASAGGGTGSSGGGAPWAVRSGYIRAPRGAAGLREAAGALAPHAPLRESLRALVRVGVQADTAVVFASRWARAARPPPCVTQVFAAALSLGAYKDPPDVPDAAWAPLATLVLEAAYEAALWAAVAAAARARAPRATAVLCGLGLGVFGNRREWVASAAGRALAALRAEGADIDVRWLHFRAVDAGLAALIDAEDAAARRGE